MYTTPVKKDEILKAIAEEFEEAKNNYFESDRYLSRDDYNYYMGCYDGIMKILNRIPIYEK